MSARCALPVSSRGASVVPWPRRHWLGTCAALLALTLGCSRTDGAGSQKEDSLVVFAAASLRDAFTTLGTAFERAHPGVTVSFNFAGTQELRTQLEHGAVADVFASADQRHMQDLSNGKRVETPVIFARNEPVLVVATEASEMIQQLSDLPAAGRIVLGASEVPIGRYTLQILDRASAALGTDFRARVEAKVVSREPNVRQVLTKISLGEADAGFVYRTDAQAAAGSVRIITIPAALNVIAEYPIARVTDAAHPTLARAWIDGVLAAEGQQVLRGAGFLSAAENRTAP